MAPEEPENLFKDSDPQCDVPEVPVVTFDFVEDCFIAPTPPPIFECIKPPIPNEPCIVCPEFTTKSTIKVSYQDDGPDCANQPKLELVVTKKNDDPCQYDFEINTEIPIPRVPCPEINVTSFGVQTFFDSTNTPTVEDPCCENTPCSTFKITPRHREPVDCNDPGECAFDVELDLQIPVPRVPCPQISITNFDVRTFFNPENAPTSSSGEQGPENCCETNPCSTFKITPKHRDPTSCDDPGECLFEIELDLKIPVPRMPCPQISITNFDVRTFFNPENAPTSSPNDPAPENCCDPSPCSTFTITPKHRAPTSCEDPGECAFDIELDLKIPVPRMPCPQINITNFDVQTFFDTENAPTNSPNDPAPENCCENTPCSTFAITPRHRPPENCEDPGACEFDVELDLKIPVPRMPCPRINVTNFGVQTFFDSPQDPNDPNNTNSCCSTDLDVSLPGDLAAIPAGSRTANMVVRTTDTGERWQLSADLTTWTKLEEKCDSTFKVTTRHRPPDNCSDPGACEFDIELDLRIPIPKIPCPQINVTKFEVQTLFNSPECCDNGDACASTFTITANHTPPADCNDPGECKFDVELDLRIPIPKIPCPKINIKKFNVDTGFDRPECCGDTVFWNQLLLVENYAALIALTLEEAPIRTYAKTTTPNKTWQRISIQNWVEVSLPPPTTCGNTFSITPRHRAPVDCNDPGECEFDIELDLFFRVPPIPCPKINVKTFSVDSHIEREKCCDPTEVEDIPALNELTLEDVPIGLYARTITPEATWQRLPNEEWLEIPPPCANEFTITTRHRAPVDCNDPGECEFDIDLKIDIPIPPIPCPRISGRTETNVGYEETPCTKCISDITVKNYLELATVPSNTQKKDMYAAVKDTVPAYTLDSDLKTWTPAGFERRIHSIAELAAIPEEDRATVTAVLKNVPNLYKVNSEGEWLPTYPPAPDYTVDTIEERNDLPSSVAIDSIVKVGTGISISFWKKIDTDPIAWAAVPNPLPITTVETTKDLEDIPDPQNPSQTLVPQTGDIVRVAKPTSRFKYVGDKWQPQELSTDDFVVYEEKDLDSIPEEERGTGMRVRLLEPTDRYQLVKTGTPPKWKPARCPKNEFAIVSRQKKPKDCKDPGECIFDIVLEINIPVPKPPCPTINIDKFKVTSAFEGDVKNPDETCTSCDTDITVNKYDDAAAALGAAPKGTIAHIEKPRTRFQLGNDLATWADATHPTISAATTAAAEDVLDAGTYDGEAIVAGQRVEIASPDNLFTLGEDLTTWTPVRDGSSSRPTQLITVETLDEMNNLLFEDRFSGLRVLVSNPPTKYSVSSDLTGFETYVPDYEVAEEKDLQTIPNADRAAGMFVTVLDPTDRVKLSGGTVVAAPCCENKFTITKKEKPKTGCNEADECEFDINLEICVPIPRIPCPKLNVTNFEVSTRFDDAEDECCTQPSGQPIVASVADIPARDALSFSVAPEGSWVKTLNNNQVWVRTSSTIPTAWAQRFEPDAPVCDNVFVITPRHKEPEDCQDPGQCEFDIDLLINVPIPRVPCPKMEGEIGVTSGFADSPCVECTADFFVLDKDSLPPPSSALEGKRAKIKKVVSAYSWDGSAWQPKTYNTPPDKTVNTWDDITPADAVAGQVITINNPPKYFTNAARGGSSPNFEYRWVPSSADASTPGLLQFETTQARDQYFATQDVSTGGAQVYVKDAPSTYTYSVAPLANSVNAPIQGWTASTPQDANITVKTEDDMRALDTTNMAVGTIVGLTQPIDRYRLKNNVWVPNSCAKNRFAIIKKHKKGEGCDDPGQCEFEFDVAVVVPIPKIPCPKLNVKKFEVKTHFDDDDNDDCCVQPTGTTNVTTVVDAAARDALTFDAVPLGGWAKTSNDEKFWIRTSDTDQAVWEERKDPNKPICDNVFTITPKHKSGGDCEENDPGQCEFDIDLVLNIPIPRVPCPKIDGEMRVTTGYSDSPCMTCVADILIANYSALLGTTPSKDGIVAKLINVRKAYMWDGASWQPTTITGTPDLLEPDEEAMRALPTQNLAANTTIRLTKPVDRYKYKNNEWVPYPCPQNRFVVSTKHTPPKDCNDPGQCEFQIDIDIAVPIPPPVCPSFTTTIKAGSYYENKDKDICGECPADLTLATMAELTGQGPIGAGPNSITDAAGIPVGPPEGTTAYVQQNKTRWRWLSQYGGWWPATCGSALLIIPKKDFTTRDCDDPPKCDFDVVIDVVVPIPQPPCPVFNTRTNSIRICNTAQPKSRATIVKRAEQTCKNGKDEQNTGCVFDFDFELELPCPQLRGGIINVIPVPPGENVGGHLVVNRGCAENSGVSDCPNEDYVAEDVLERDILALQLLANNAIVQGVTIFKTAQPYPDGAYWRYRGLDNGTPQWEEIICTSGNASSICSFSFDANIAVPFCQPEMEEDDDQGTHTGVPKADRLKVYYIKPGEKCPGVANVPCPQNAVKVNDAAARDALIGERPGVIWGLNSNGDHVTVPLEPGAIFKVGDNFYRIDGDPAGVPPPLPLTYSAVMCDGIAANDPNAKKCPDAPIAPDTTAVDPWLGKAADPRAVNGFVVQTQNDGQYWKLVVTRDGAEINNVVADPRAGFNRRIRHQWQWVPVICDNNATRVKMVVKRDKNNPCKMRYAIVVVMCQRQHDHVAACTEYYGEECCDTGCNCGSPTCCVGPAGDDKRPDKEAQKDGSEDTGNAFYKSAANGPDDPNPPLPLMAAPDFDAPQEVWRPVLAVEQAGDNQNVKADDPCVVAARAAGQTCADLAAPTDPGYRPYKALELRIKEEYPQDRLTPPKVKYNLEAAMNCLHGGEVTVKKGTRPVVNSGSGSSSGSGTALPADAIGSGTIKIEKNRVNLDLTLFTADCPSTSGPTGPSSPGGSLPLMAAPPAENQTLTPALLESLIRAINTNPELKAAIRHVVNQPD